MESAHLIFKFLNILFDIQRLRVPSYFFSPEPSKQLIKTKNSNKTR